MKSLMKRLIVGGGLFLAGTIGAYAQAEIIPTAVGTPEEAVEPGEAVTIPVTIRNAGDEPVEPGESILVRLEFGAGFDPVDREVTFVEGLEEGNAADVDVSFTVGDVENGEYSVLASVEYDGDVNTLQGPPIRVEAFADLTIAEIDFSDRTYHPGETVGFNVLIENIGSRDVVDEFDLRIWLRNEDRSIVNETTVRVTGGVPADGERNVSASVLIPADSVLVGVDSETLEVMAFVDVQNEIEESDVTNNDFGPVDLEVFALPDLRIVDLEYEQGVYNAGDPVPFRVTIRNNSANPLNPAELTRMVANFEEYRFTVRLSTDPSFDADDFELFFVDLSGDGQGNHLLPGEEFTISWIQAMPGNFSGTFFVQAKVDEFDAIEEYVEDSFLCSGNNIWYETTTARITILPATWPTLFRASVDDDGEEAGAMSDRPQISGDGRFVVFQSEAALDASDSNQYTSIYLRDTVSGRTILVSGGVGGAAPNGYSENPAISRDGRWVVFSSDATNLVPGDVNAHFDIFLYDRVTESISLISTGLDGQSANAGSHLPDISADGARVVFHSTATNLTPEGGNGFKQVYLWERDDEISLISGDGAPASGDSSEAKISYDGSTAVFRSYADDLVAGSGGDHSDVFRYTIGDAIEAITSGNADSFQPVPSEDGSVVAFASSASNLTGDTLHAVRNVYRHAAGTTTLVSRNQEGDGLTGDSLEPSISADGNLITFRGFVYDEWPHPTPPPPGDGPDFLHTDLTRSDGTVFAADPITGSYDLAGMGFGADIEFSDRIVGYTDTNGVSDIYLYDAATGDRERVSVNRFGYQVIRVIGERSVPSSRDAVISADGRFVVFASDAHGAPGLIHGRTNKIGLDQNGVRDVFVHDRRTSALPGPTDLETTLIFPRGGDTVETKLGVEIPVVAQVYSPVRPVERVEFYANNMLIGVEEAPILADPATANRYGMMWEAPHAGTFHLSAVAYDDQGSTSAPTAVATAVVDAGPSLPPEVEIRSPLSGESATSASTVPLLAQAMDPDGDLVSVQFLLNGALHGDPVERIPSANPAEFPFFKTWTPDDPGIYTIGAAALDSSGNMVFAEPVTVNVTTGVDAPAIVLTSPAEGAVSLGEPVTVAATASAGSGRTLTRVEYFVNGDSLGSVGGLQESQLTWTPAVAGYHLLWAVARDDANNITVSAPVALVVADGLLPEVRFVRPDPVEDNYPIGATIDIWVDATDADGTIERVEIFDNGVLIESFETAPYRFDYAADRAGLHHVRAVATDNHGNTGDSVISFAVGLGSAPAIAYEDDADGDGFADEPILVNAEHEVVVEVTDPDPLDEVAVAMFLDGEEMAVTRSADRFNFAFTPGEAGDYTVETVATDLAGNESRATIVYAAGTPEPPEISMHLPAGTSSYAANVLIPIEVEIDEVFGFIERVDLYRNGTLIATRAGAPYHFEFHATQMGWHTFEAVATDNRGFTGSDERQIRVGRGSAPAIAYEDDAGGDGFADEPILVNAEHEVVVEVTDPDAFDTVTVTFQVNGESVDEQAIDRDGDTYSFSFAPEQVRDYIVTAIATDLYGHVVEETIVYEARLAVDGGPSVELLTPEAESVVTRGSSVLAYAGVTPGLDSVDRVEFFVNGRLVETVSDFPYTFLWMPVATETPVGVAHLQAVAYDLEGRAGASPTVTLEVATGEGGSAPQAILNTVQSPVPVGRPVLLRASAQVSQSSVTHVDFFVDGELLDTASTEGFQNQYSAVWTPQNTGEFVLHVVAYDARGNQGAAIPQVVAVSGDSLLAVDLVEPEDGAILARNRTHVLRADVFSASGTNATVRFLINGPETMAIEADGFPYEAEWTPQDAGAYSIIAEVTEIIGEELRRSYSEISEVNVEAGEPPTVSIVRPTTGQSVTAGSEVRIEVNASSPDGHIASVDVRVNGQLVETLTDEPFMVDHIFGAKGTHTIEAIARDNFGATATARRNVQVSDRVNENLDVFLNISPASRATDGRSGEGHITQGSQVLLRAVVEHDRVEGEVAATTVVFSSNGEEVAVLEEAPYFHVFSPQRDAGATFSSYAVEALAIAFDAEGEELGRGRVSRDELFIEEGGLTPPDIHLVSPMEGDNLTVGSSTYLRAELTNRENIGRVSRVVFYADDQYIGEDNSEPFTLDWVPAFGGENVEIRAAVYLQEQLFVYNPFPTPPEAVNVTPSRFSQARTVSIAEPIGVLPTVELKVLPNETEVAQSSRMLLYANPQRIDGAVESVSFSVNGVPFATTDSAPWVAEWVAPSAGVYFLNATVTDDDGNTANSNFATIAVTSQSVPTVDGAIPTVLLTGPEDGAVLRSGTFVSLSAEINRFVNPPQSVIFYVNGEIVGSAESSPFAIDWFAQFDGPAVLFATATADLTGGGVYTAASRVREVALIDLQEVGTPQIDDLTRTPSGPVLRNQEIRFRFRVSDSGIIDRIEFFRDGRRIGEKRRTEEIPLPSGNYEFTDTPPDLGEYQYRVRVTNLGGRQAVRDFPEISIVLGDPPMVSLTDPSPGTLVARGEPVELRATASDPNSGGRITEVEFLRDGQSIGTATEAPYHIEFEPDSAGEMVLTAVATSLSGHTAESSPVVIEVLDESLPTIESFETSVHARQALVGERITFTADVSDDEGIARVVLFENGREVAEATTPPFVLATTPSSSGAVEYHIEAVNVNGLSRSSSPITIHVRWPDPVGDDDDFVYQTLLDMQFESPSLEDRSDWVEFLETADRDVFVTAVLQSDDFVSTRLALMLRSLMTGSWGDVPKARAGVQVIESLNVRAFAESLLPDFKGRLWGGRTLPAPTDARPQVDEFVRVVWRAKYGADAPDPTADQLDPLFEEFQWRSTDSFFAVVASDHTGIDGRTNILGIRNAPNNRLMDESFAAALLITLLRIEPTNEEVAALSREEKITQVRAVINDPRYAARFVGPLQGAVEYPAHVQHSGWFGWFSDYYDPWVYHYELGWLYLWAETPESIFIYDFELGWLWTSDNYYYHQSLLYQYASDSWIRYSKGSGWPRQFESMDGSPITR